ncbi:MAG: HDOD domain-containing protein [Deltaproteobacteria bacterium]|nr:HDOD domain-containing protein [Deltaproteobacteria bacterium]
MKPGRMDKIISDVKSFPSMSNMPVKILKLIDDPQSSAAKIEELLRYDPGITANILKLTNSAYFGLSSRVGSVRQAIVLLGWRHLGKLVVASCVNAILDKPVPGYDLPAGELWRHSIAVSVAAELLAKELGISANDEIFTAALLHDLGKLVLANYVREDLQAIETAAGEGIPFHAAERRVLGTDHAEIGARLLKSWSFPLSLVKAVRWHHDPDAAKEPRAITDLVHVANMLCLMIGIGVGREGLRYEPSQAAAKRLGLKTRQLEFVASQTLQWANELSEVFEAGQANVGSPPATGAE